jgi:hypothetical protein
MSGFPREESCNRLVDRRGVEPLTSAVQGSER